jgi:MFS transporter, AAHS family, 4-hydroxybenzoate transporter
MTLAAVGHASQSIALVILFLGLAGFFFGVASSGLIALTTLLYSTPIRFTGVGWAMGLGRLGSFVEPLAIGLLVNRGWQQLCRTRPACAVCCFVHEPDRHPPAPQCC